MDLRDAQSRLQHILREIRNARDFVGDLDFEAFRQDLKTTYAVIRCFEIIGEAVKKLPRTLRKAYSQIPWVKVAGMRDKLIHDYEYVDLQRVYDTALRELPVLEQVVMQMLQDLESRSPQQD
ncbi:MAG: DUF86 domain-containing protein [Fimbriimonadales bacterium]|nr:DUF86 domain-containing protein [Fimbriimonadales bacterium]